MALKIYGHSETCPSEFLNLKEVSVIAEPQILRELALFLVSAANVMESTLLGGADHYSFEDFYPDSDEDWPEVTVMNTKVFKQ